MAGVRLAVLSFECSRVAVKVDIHSHFMPPAYAEALWADGGVYRARLERDATGEAIVVTESGMRYEVPAPALDAGEKIRELDRLGFDVAAVSPPLTIVHYELRGDEMRRHVRLVNDAMAELQSAYPDRLVAMGILPMQDPDAAVRELDHMVDELGLRGAVICTNVLGKNLDEPEFRPVFARAAERGVLLFVHAWFVAGADRLPRYHLLNSIGNPFDAAIAVASIVFSGMLDEYPGLRICVAHGGGAIAFVIGRIDRGYRIRPQVREAIPRPPSEYLSRLYYDTIVHNGVALQFLVDLVGPENILAGSDCPWHLTDMGDPQPLQTVAALRVSEDDRRRIAGETAAKLLAIG